MLVKGWEDGDMSIEVEFEAMYRSMLRAPFTKKRTHNLGSHNYWKTN